MLWPLKNEKLGDYQILQIAMYTALVTTYQHTYILPPSNNSLGWQHLYTNVSCRPIPCRFCKNKNADNSYIIHNGLTIIHT